MNFYKKIIRSRNLRIKILNLLSFIPDKTMVKIQYRIKTGRKLNLNNPQRFTEKLQSYKLFYRNDLMPKCVDKFEVRQYVERCGYKDILNPLIGIYNNINEINFDYLPKKFVAKDTLAGGGTSIFICRDKDKVDKIQFFQTLEKWLNTKCKKNVGREWVYDNGKSRIIIEKYIDSSKDEGGLIDYKFFCFNGKVEYVYGIADRDLGNGAGLGIFDKDFNLLPYQRLDENKLTRELKKPLNYNEMVKCAEVLSKEFPHARIDLYNQNGKIIFGEITFFDGSGYMKFEPDKFDFLLGEKFNIKF